MLAIWVAFSAWIWLVDNPSIWVVLSATTCAALKPVT